MKAIGCFIYFSLYKSFSYNPLFVYVCLCLSPFVFPVSVMYNLDEDESQGGIAINLQPLMTQEHKTDTTQPAGVKRERYY